ncbi:hypothetical protein NUU61_005120 [Penicillium alfredii]|uniref:Zn(2)-C6 fungal-type domain-containing protein n=1 Tax=Penicillium alfredii TaxID=1506179 RepID=A0A9W9F955_9EURO|nr:uncharacterized protein NUU61_005120 [Penicillium alfredii]KAJ5095764.1 hypothetical protein NUU61_005120 [Penicillium alfredii]
MDRLISYEQAGQTSLLWGNPPGESPQAQPSPEASAAFEANPVNPINPNNNNNTTTTTTNTDDASTPSKSRRGRWDPEPDWSEMVRAKISRSRRTGQACDRCKLRKMRCDANPDGCNSCISRGFDCKITDRLTGDTFTRGATRRMQKEILDLKRQVNSLTEENERLETTNEILRGRLSLFMEHVESVTPSSQTTELTTPGPACPCLVGEYCPMHKRFAPAKVESEEQSYEATLYHALTQ